MKFISFNSELCGFSFEMYLNNSFKPSRVMSCDRRQGHILALLKEKMSQKNLPHSLNISWNLS